jgi:hypothetical protein
MSISDCRWFKRVAEFLPKDDIRLVPKRTRGLYALFHFRRGLNRYDVVYVGLAGGAKTGVGGRLRSHARSKAKGKLWTHFSIFEVWENVWEHEVAELEGLFRHIYSRDTKANRLNVQRSFKPLKRVRNQDLAAWTPPAVGSGRGAA